MCSTAGCSTSALLVQENGLCVRCNKRNKKVEPAGWCGGPKEVSLARPRRSFVILRLAHLLPQVRRASVQMGALPHSISAPPMRPPNTAAGDLQHHGSQWRSPAGNPLGTAMDTHRSMDMSSAMGGMGMGTGMGMGMGTGTGMGMGTSMHASMDTGMAHSAIGRGEHGRTGAVDMHGLGSVNPWTSAPPSRPPSMMARQANQVPYPAFHQPQAHLPSWQRPVAAAQGGQAQAPAVPAWNIPSDVTQSISQLRHSNHPPQPPPHQPPEALKKQHSIMNIMDRGGTGGAGKVERPTELKKEHSVAHFARESAASERQVMPVGDSGDDSDSDSDSDSDGESGATHQKARKTKSKQGSSGGKARRNSTKGRASRSDEVKYKM